MKISEMIRNIRRPRCTMVVAAAGESSRMGEDKLFSELAGIPVLARTLMALEKCSYIDEIIVVTREDKLEQAAQLCLTFEINKANKFLIGGSDRLHSAIAGVYEASVDSRVIGIHDGARPFIEDDLIKSVILCADRYGAAAPAIPVQDTIKIASSGVVESTPRRDKVVAVQTPQVFQADIIKCALSNADQNELSVTDDCSAVEAIDFPVHLVGGDPDNIKLTSPRDIETALSILRRRGEQT